MPPVPNAPIGFCGLGAMGFGMAAHLVKSGHKVQGFDVFPDPLKRFSDLGGTACSALPESAHNASYYIVMVANSIQAEKALWGDSGIVKALPNGATLLLMSTVSASYAKEVAANLKKERSDIEFVDAPVSGGAARAAAGTLSIMAASDEESTMDKSRWLLDLLSDEEKLYIVAGGVGQGSNMKMVHQVLAGIQILATSEAMGLACRLGLDAKSVVDKVIGEGGNGESWSWMFENRMPRMLTEDYYPGASALTIILKDVGIITQQSRLHHFPTPLTSTAEQAYLSGLSQGFGSHDDAGMVRCYYPSPVSSIKTSLSPEETESKTNTVLTLLRTIHLLAAAECLALAHHLQLPLPQLFTLASTAAGGSAQFTSFAPDMLILLSMRGKVGSSETRRVKKRSIARIMNDMEEVMQRAREVNAPLFLGAEAYQMLTVLRRDSPGYGEEAGEATAVEWWADVLREGPSGEGRGTHSDVAV